MNPFAKEALRRLEQAEDMLHLAEGFETHRERVSNARIKLGADLMQDAYTEAVEQADIGDTLLAQESDGTVTYLNGTKVQDE